MRYPRLLLPCLLLSLALVGTTPSIGVAEEDKADKTNFAQDMLQGITVGDPNEMFHGTRFDRYIVLSIPADRGFKSLFADFV